MAELCVNMDGRCIRPASARACLRTIASLEPSSLADNADLCLHTPGAKDSKRAGWLEERCKLNTLARDAELCLVVMHSEMACW